MDIAAHSPHKTSSYIIVAVAYVFYLMVLTMFFDRVGWAIAPLAIIPVTAGSWYFGIGGGILLSARELIPTDVPIGQGVTGRVAETGQAIRVGNVADVKDYIDVDQRTSSELCVPITLKNRVLGVINTESTKLDAFSLDDELLLGTLAGQLATAIEQLRAVQAERQWLHQLAHSNGLIYALAHIMTHIEQAMSQEEIIHTVSEEFVVLLPETPVEMALHVAERLRAYMEDTPIRTSAMELTVTVSIGVSAKDENTLDLETLLARADQAMYIAKHKGRNRVAVSK